MTEFHARLEDVLRLSRSAAVDVIRERMRKHDRPHAFPRVFGDARLWCAVVSWPGERHHWLLLPLCVRPAQAQPPQQMAPDYREVEW